MLDLIKIQPQLIHSPTSGTYSGYCLPLQENTIEEFLAHYLLELQVGLTLVPKYGLKKAALKLLDQSNYWGHDCDYPMNATTLLLAEELLEYVL